MSGDEQRPGDPESGEELHEREDDARRARAEAEGERAAAERDDETAERGEDAVLPADTDEERFGVMPPPEGT